MQRSDSLEAELVGVDPELAAFARLIKAKTEETQQNNNSGKKSRTTTANPFTVLSSTDRKKTLHSKLARDISKYSAAAELEDEEGNIDEQLKSSGGWGSRAPAFTPSDLGTDWKRRQRHKNETDDTSSYNDDEDNSPLDEDAPEDETLQQKQARRREMATRFLGGGGSKSRAKAATVKGGALQQQQPTSDEGYDDESSSSPWKISASNLNSGGPVSSSKNKKNITRDVPKELNHKFSHLLIIDFEATCDAAEPEYPHEIIEFPCVAVEMETGCIVSEFQTFVRPTLNPILTEFCTVLTGIRQEDVDAAPLLPQAVLMFRAWLEGLGKDWVEHGSIERFIEDKKQKGSTAAATSTNSSSAGGEEDGSANEAASTSAASPPSSPVVANTNGSPLSSSSPLVYMNPPLRPGQVTMGDAAKLRSELVDTFLAALEQTEKSSKGDGEGKAATASGGKQSSISSPVTSSPTTSGNPSSSKAATRRFIPAIGTDGPWDMRKFMHECSVLRDGHVFPELFYSWVDVRRNFSDFHKKRLMKLTHMLRFLGLSFIGERHRGIDDARNIARVAMSLVRKGYKFRQVCQIPYLAEGSADLAQQRVLSDLLQDEMKKGGGGNSGSGMGSKKQSSEGNKNKKGGGKNSNNNSQKGKNKKKK